MIALFKYLWRSDDTDKQKQLMEKRIEQRLNYLDSEINREENKNVIQSGDVRESGPQLNSEDKGENREKLANCYKKKGVITKIGSNYGVIDNDLFFDLSVAVLANEFRVGGQVEYLAHRNPQTELIKLIKVEQTNLHLWNDEIDKEQIAQEIKDLGKELPTFFDTHQRKIIGVVVERKPDIIVVDTGKSTIEIRLDDVELEFIPIEGDRVSLACAVQSDDGFLDKNGEVVQWLSVKPERMLNKERCIVTQVHEDWGVLNKDCFFEFNVLPFAYRPNVGDELRADMIECERGSYIWRCTKMFDTVNSARSAYTHESQKQNIKKHTVIIKNYIYAVFSSTFKTKDLYISIKNTRQRQVKLESIESLSKREHYITILEPEPNSDGCIIPAHSEFKARLKVEAVSYGEAYEKIRFNFEGFGVQRTIRIFVCEDEESAKEKELMLENREEEESPQSVGFNAMNKSRQVSRQYAYHVGKNRKEVVPGVGLSAKRRFVAVRIPTFDVPERLRELLLTSDSLSSMKQALEIQFPSVIDDLNETNYRERFQTLMHIEEIEQFTNFRRYDRERAHFRREGEFLSLTIENLAECRPSLVMGDIVRASNPWNEKQPAYDGVIHKVLFDRVLLKFNAGFQDRYNGEDYRLTFYFSRYGYRKQHFAITSIMEHLGAKFLFPNKLEMRPMPQLDVHLNDSHKLIIKDVEHEWFNNDLNEIQKRAVCNVMRGEVHQMPYIIFGPPGTGKTLTMIEIILQLTTHLSSARLIVAAPSNSAADLITSRLAESEKLLPGDFVRLVSANSIEKELVPQHLLKYCATADFGIEGSCHDDMIVTESGLRMKCQMKFLGRHRITISTCSTIGNFLQMNFPEDHFTHVLIDESGQCSEPEIMVPIRLISKKRGQVILAGDPRQLQAVILSAFAIDRGMSLSYMERILDTIPYAKDKTRYEDTCGYNPCLVTKLLYNYRALPSILSVYNTLFYDSELRPVIKPIPDVMSRIDKVIKRPPGCSENHASFFYGVRGSDNQEPDSPSWFNPIEAREVFIMCCELFRKGFEPQQVGILTPYSKQVKVLRGMFEHANVQPPKIGSVEEFQGQEREVILISTVRSNETLLDADERHSLGFVRCSKRMNVSISRARYLMIVYGNPHLLSLDSNWHRYIQYCVAKNSYLGCDLPEDFEQVPADQISKIFDIIEE